MRAFLVALEMRPARHRQVRQLLVDIDKRKLTTCSKWDECFDTCAIILRTIAPTLQTFFIALESTAFTLRTLMPVGMCFPHLIHLTVYASHGTRRHYQVPDNVAAMPALQFVHFYSRDRASDWVYPLVAAAPRLVHLHLTAGDEDGSYLAILLGRPVASYNGILEDAESPPRTLPSTVRVTVQTYKSIPSGTCGTPIMEMRQGLRKLQRYHGSGPKVVLLEERPANRPYGAREARQQWLDVVAGGSGCWSVPNVKAARRNRRTAAM